MAEYLDEAGLEEVWSKISDGFAEKGHTHSGYASSSHTHSTATTSSAGFLGKLSGSTTQYLNGAGNWATPSSGGLTFTNLYSNTSGSTGTVTLSSSPTSFKFIYVEVKAYLYDGGRSTGWATPNSYIPHVIVPVDTRTYDLPNFGTEWYETNAQRGFSGGALVQLSGTTLIPTRGKFGSQGSTCGGGVSVDYNWSSRVTSSSYDSYPSDTYCYISKVIGIK